MLISSFRIHERRPLTCLFGLLFLVGLMHWARTRALSQSVQKSLANYRTAQGASDVQWLDGGKPIERKLSGGESHTYQLNVATGQYARVIVDQKGIDVVVSLIGPDGKLITAVGNPNGSQGAETVHITAEATGIYRLEVTSFEKEAQAGLYQARRVEVRPATEADKKHLMARRAFDEGQRLQDQNTPESLPVSRKNFEDALSLYREIEDPIEQVTVLIGMANTNRLMNDSYKALECFKEALRIAQNLGDKYREARALEFAADVYTNLGEMENALRTSDQAYSLYQATGAKRTEATMLNNIGDIYGDMGEPDRAREYYGRSLRLYRALNAKYNEAITLQSIGYSYRVEDNSQKALGYFNEALSIFRDLNIHEEEARTLSLISNEFADSNDRQKALANAEEALNLLRYPDVQKLVAAVVLSRIGRTSEIRARNSRYASLTMPQPLGIRGIHQQVLDDNTILLDFELGERRSYLWTITPDSVRSYQLPPKAQIETQVGRVYELLTARQPAPNLTLGQQRAREKAADLRYQTEASVLSNMLLAPVAKQLETKRLAIVADGALQYVPFAVLPTPATSGGETKIDPRPLNLDHEIVSLPSASVLAALRRDLADRKPATKTVAVLADPVFEVDDARVKSRLTSRTSTGDSSPAATSTLKRALRSVRGDEGSVKLQRLLFSRDKAEAILSLTSNQSNLEALDFRANRKLAMSDQLSQYRIVHFSTHGLLDSRRPELSGLVLSLVDEAGRPQDGLLRLSDIYTLRLNADLVVLRACQTGLGKEVRGEGLIGLVRGFMYAGAPRVMASMWEVDDAATAELMKRFYRGVLQQEVDSGGSAESRADRYAPEEPLAIALLLGSIRASGRMALSGLPQKSLLIIRAAVILVCVRSCELVDRHYFWINGAIHETTRTKHKLAVTQINFRGKAR